MAGYLEITNCDLKEGKSEMKKVAKKKSVKLAPKVDEVAGKVFVIRGHKVMLDRDLAELYEVPTKALNQAVKRNIERFPEDFMFRLNKSEMGVLVTNCDRLKTLKHATSSPTVFTEQGVAMLSSVLKGERAYGRFLPSWYCGYSGFSKPSGEVGGIANSTDKLVYFDIPLPLFCRRVNDVHLDN